MALAGLSAKDLQMHDGMVLGGLLSGGVSNLMIALLKRHRAEPSASPKLRSDRVAWRFKRQRRASVPSEYMIHSK